jgi:vitamin B12 transporter
MKITLYVLAALATSSYLHAQTGLQGLVKDPQGHLVAGAKVRVLAKDSGVASGLTSTSGTYRFEATPEGMLLLEVRKDGFRTTVMNVEVRRGSMKQQDVALEIAGVNQSVVVTSSGAAQVDAEISKSVTVIENEEIQNWNAISLGDILRYSPGLQVRNGGGIGQNTSIRIRGLRADASAVLIDGLRFRDATTTQGDSSSFISTLNFIEAERVEVLRGAGSSLYGTNAVGGAVNVVTRQGGGPLRGELQAEGGNLGLLRTRGALSGGAFGDRLKFTAGLLHLNLRHGIDGRDANRSTGGQGFLRYDFNPKVIISDRLWASDDFLQTNNSPSAAGIPAANIPATGTVAAIALPQDQVQIINTGGVPSYGNATFIPGRDHLNSRRASGFFTNALVLRHAASGRFNWQANYQRVHTNRTFQNWTTGATVALNVSNYIGDIDTATARGTALITPWLTVSGGYEFENESYYDKQDNNQPAPRRVLENTHISQRSNSGFFASQISLFDRRLQVSLSGRAQNFSLTKPVFDAQGTISVYDGVTLGAPRRALTGDVSVAYLIAKSNTKLRAHLGNSYRAPALYERFGGGFSNSPATGVVNFTPYGDPNLLPDRYNSVDSGIDQYFFSSRLRVSATHFYTRIVQITAFNSSGALNAATDTYKRTSGYINGAGGISRGIEIATEARPISSLTVSGSYTYTNANTDRDISVLGFFQALGVHPHTATLVATQRWGKRLDTTMTVFHGGSHYSSLFAAGRSRAYKFNGYTNAGLMFSYRFWEGEKGTARLYMKIDNALNQTYYEQGWLASRATFVTGIGYTF